MSFEPLPMRVLAIGAHPDDIEIGCGGALSKYRKQGHRVFLLVLSDGAMGGDKEIRKREQERVVELLDAEELFWGGFQDTKIDLNLELILSIENVVSRVNPDFVFVNFYDDTHQDHRNTTKATISATRYVRNVLMYETPTTQNFMPSVYVELTRELLEMKEALLSAHASQIERTNISGVSIIEIARSTANFRGVQSRTAFAEAFQPLRMFINVLQPR